MLPGGTAPDDGSLPRAMGAGKPNLAPGKTGFLRAPTRSGEFRRLWAIVAEGDERIKYEG